MFSQRSSHSQLLLAVLIASIALATREGSAQSPSSRASSASRAAAAAYADQQIRIPPSATAPQKQAAERSPQQSPVVTADAPAMHRPSRKASLVRQAAHGHIVEELPPQQLNRSAVRQASHSCDCHDCATAPLHGDAHCGAEPGCGFGAGCGVAGCYDPSCGLEVGCGFESGYPLEAACGVEAIGCDGYGCDVGSCAQCIDGCAPVFRIIWQRFEFFAGVNSFTGPANHTGDSADRRGGSGSFGFYEGFNEGRSLNRLIGLDLASQFGMRATQSSLSGAEFTEEARKQIFLTGGLFRRVDFGLQYGLVVDYLYDDWWYRNNLVQLRGELSWNDACGHEFGYQFMAGTKDSTSATTLIGDNNTLITGTATFEPTNQHRLFLRGNTRGGGSYMAFAGGTDRGDGLLGASLMSAFRGRFAVQGGATYLIPSESHRGGGFENEAWNLSMGIVFRPGGKAGCGRYCRPLFDVADNGTFMVDRR